VTDAKVAVYACAIDLAKTETKGNVVIKTADELANFSRGEEEVIENIIASIAETGAKVVVTGGNIGEMALHYMERHGLMAIKVLSKFDLRRLCRAIHAKAVVDLTAPTQEQLGHCERVYVEEISSNKVTIFAQDDEASGVATVVVRGATKNIMDDIERAIDDGVNCVKVMTKDKRFVAGAGATELELARRLQEYADTCPGLEQYAIREFGRALEVVPRTIASNAGLIANEVMASLYAAHTAGNVNVGVDIDGEGVCDAFDAGIIDPFATKAWGLRFATEAASTVLHVDHLVMARRAGGPKPPAQGARDAS